MNKAIKLLLLIVVFIGACVFAYVNLSQNKPASALDYLNSDEQIKAGEFIKAAMNSVGLKDPNGKSDSYQWYVETAIQKGYMKAETFKSMDVGVQRIDGAIFLLHMFDDVKGTKIALYPESFTYFRDLPDVPIQKRLYGLRAFTLGIIELNNGILRPHTLLTKKEAKAYIERMLYPEKRIVPDVPTRTTSQNLDGINFDFTDDIVVYPTDGEKWDVSRPKSIEFFEKSLRNTTFSWVDNNTIEVKGTLPATPMGFAWRYSISFMEPTDEKNKTMIKTVDRTDEQLENVLPKHGGEFSYQIKVPSGFKPENIIIKGAVVWERVYSFSYLMDYTMGDKVINITGGTEGEGSVNFEGLSIK